MTSLGAACPFCSSAAAAAKAGAVHALRNGILVLSIPPVLICAAIILLAVRRRDRFKSPCPGDAQQLPGRSVRISGEDFAGGSRIGNEVARSPQES